MLLLPPVAYVAVVDTEEDNGTRWWGWWGDAIISGAAFGAVNAQDVCKNAAAQVMMSDLISFYVYGSVDGEAS